MGDLKNIETRLFINNEFVQSKSEERYTVYNPATGKHVADIPVANVADVDAAVAAASAAYKGPWSKFSAEQRAACLNKLADLLDAKKSEIGQLETACMGTPAAIATHMLPPMGTKLLRYYAGWADKVAGESFPPDGEGDELYKIVQYEPLGVCAAIAAWNATPLYLGTKMAPAVATGNTVVFKASEKSPLGINVAASCVAEAGFPPGVINFVSGGGSTGALLAGHMGIAKISFTGSGITGRKVQEAAARSNMKRVTLELGGKSPAVVFADANIPNATEAAVDRFLMLTSQVCVAPSRLFVHSSIAEKFIATAKERFEQIGKSWGASSDPTSMTTMHGPLADQTQLKRVLDYIESGKQDAKLITGGERIGNEGCFVQPTIFLDPKPDAKIYREEIFGPVLTIRTFETEDEAMELANATTYGLAAYVFTSDMGRALRVARKLEAGTVNINSGGGIDVRVPMGGIKASGSGREYGKLGLMAYLELKTITMNLNAGGGK